ncbi:unnamed protein product [Prunus armeniaca]|uniref:Uncharacterized protein n=1 Tax=Prunus armeniaca TaxID=36596 RepID=A0A6J5YC64_PRUAR|nr:unnamed protein product [Prunus armeniaca]CAB4321134.1 unnamed protein product [Prunus armeniaca]
METRVSELMRVDQLISSLMARLRQANKEKRDRCRKINNDIAITVTCQLEKNIKLESNLHKFVH